MKTLKRVFGILNYSEKKRFIIVCFFLMILTVFEVVGIGLIFPIISFVINPDKFILLLNKYDYFNVFSNLDITKTSQLFLVLIFLFYLIKFLMSVLLNFYKSKILYGISASISRRMYEGYTHQTLSFFNKSNSAYIIRNIIDMPNKYVSRVLVGIYTIGFEVCFISLLFLMFIKIQPQIGYSILGICLVFIISFNLSQKNKTKIYGKSLDTKVAERLKVTKESLEGIQDLHIFNKHDYFQRIFDNNNFRVANLITKLELKSTLPRLILELVGVSFFLAIIFYLFFTNQAIDSSLPVLGVTAAAMVRLIPSVSKILSFSNGIHASQNAINELDKELNKFKKIKENNHEFFSLKNSLNFKNISFCYDDQKILFSNMNFDIQRNSIFGIAGESGKGKTTILNLLLGFLNPKEGEISVDGKNIQNNIKNWQKIISFIPQKIFISDGTIKENICYGLEQSEINKEKLKRACELSGVTNFIKNFDDLDQKIGERGTLLSSGQIQRVGLARALYKEPKLLILDEFTNFLDEKTKNQILENVKNLKKYMTIIIVSHDKKTISTCDKVLQL
tara:strand:- start:2928 stop:4613 length:1686 start_codon:yes stop_codon:yes gene_type:complete